MSSSRQHDRNVGSKKYVPDLCRCPEAAFLGHGGMRSGQCILRTMYGSMARYGKRFWIAPAFLNNGSYVSERARTPGGVDDKAVLGAKRHGGFDGDVWSETLLFGGSVVRD